MLIVRTDIEEYLQCYFFFFFFNYIVKSRFITSNKWIFFLLISVSVNCGEIRCCGSLYFMNITIQGILKNSY